LDCVLWKVVPAKPIFAIKTLPTPIFPVDVKQLKDISRRTTDMGHAELLRKFLGKPIRDIYGRNLGIVVGMILDEQGGVGSIGIERGDGVFGKYYAENILIQGEDLVLVPSWRVSAEQVQSGIAQTERRIDALDQLHSSGKISTHTYKNLKKSYDSVVGQRNGAREKLMAELKSRSGELADESNELEEFLANIEVQHLTGELDEEAYGLAIGSLKLAYNRMIAEKNDIESLMGEFAGSEQKKGSLSAVPDAGSKEDSVSEHFKVTE
jgi:hypothetical protein